MPQKSYPIDDLNLSARELFPHLAPMFDELDKIAGSSVIRPDVDVREYPHNYQRLRYGRDRKRAAMKKAKSKYAEADLVKAMGAENADDAIDVYRTMIQLRNAMRRPAF